MPVNQNSQQLDGFKPTFIMGGILPTSSCDQIKAYGIGTNDPTTSRGEGDQTILTGSTLSDRKWSCFTKTLLFLNWLSIVLSGERCLPLHQRGFGFCFLSPVAQGAGQ